MDGGANAHGLLGQTDLRYGHLNLQNNFGSELLAQPLPLSTEYYDSSAADFITNVDDSSPPERPPMYCYTTIRNPGQVAP